MPGFIPFIFVGFVLLVIVAGVLGYYQRKARREALTALAASKGLHFDPERRHGLDEQFAAFDCLRQGSNRYAYNRLTGRWNGREILAFDYHYETHSTDSKGRRKTNHHHFSAVILASDVPLKPLLIRPEGFFDRIKGFFGFDDIDFESAEFSKQFYVKAPDRRWAYDVIHARAMQFLLDSPRYTIQFDRRHVLVRHSGRLQAEQFPSAIVVVEGLLDQLPEYVLQQQRQLD